MLQPGCGWAVFELVLKSHWPADCFAHLHLWLPLSVLLRQFGTPVSIRMLKPTKTLLMLLPATEEVGQNNEISYFGVLGRANFGWPSEGQGTSTSGMYNGEQDMKTMMQHDLTVSALCSRIRPFKRVFGAMPEAERQPSMEAANTVYAAYEACGKL